MSIAIGLVWIVPSRVHSWTTVGNQRLLSTCAWVNVCVCFVQCRQHIHARCATHHQCAIIYSTCHLAHHCHGCLHDVLLAVRHPSPALLRVPQKGTFPPPSSFITVLIFTVTAAEQNPAIGWRLYVFLMAHSGQSSLAYAPTFIIYWWSQVKSSACFVRRWHRWQFPQQHSISNKTLFSTALFDNMHVQATKATLKAYIEG